MCQLSICLFLSLSLPLFLPMFPWYACVHGGGCGCACVCVYSRRGYTESLLLWPWLWISVLPSLGANHILPPLYEQSGETAQQIRCLLLISQNPSTKPSGWESQPPLLCRRKRENTERATRQDSLFLHWIPEKPCLDVKSGEGRRKISDHKHCWHTQARVYMRLHTSKHKHTCAQPWTH